MLGSLPPSEDPIFRSYFHLLKMHMSAVELLSVPSFQVLKKKKF